MEKIESKKCPHGFGWCVLLEPETMWGEYNGKTVCYEECRCAKQSFAVPTKEQADVEVRHEQMIRNEREE